MAIKRSRNNSFIIIAIVLITIGFSYSPWFERLSVISTDLLLLARHQFIGQTLPPEKSDTVVIAVDEQTYHTEPFAKLPKVLWTPMIAKVQDAALKAGAKVIGYDIIFPTSLESYLPGYEKPFLLSLLKASRQNKIVLGKVQHSENPVAPHASQSFVVKNNKNIRALNMSVDIDDIIRRIPLQFKTEAGGLENSMALELASRAAEKQLTIDENDTLLFGDYPIPGDLKHGPLINFQGGSDIPAYSLSDLYACVESGNQEFFEKNFAGKVVMLGGVLDVEDRKLTSKRWMTSAKGTAAYIDRCTNQKPIEKLKQIRRDSIPGVFITATAVNNFINQNFLRTLPDIGVKAILVIVVILMAVISLVLRPVTSTLVMILGVSGVFVAGILFLQTLLVIPVLSIVTTLFISYALMLIYRYLYLDKQKNHMRNLFGMYLEPALVDQMIDSENMPKLGGEEKEITAWFADLANFTTISEGLSPNELVSLMNVFFEAVTEIIESHGGFVAQYVGDEVYAVFGAPFKDEHMCGRAVAAALSVKETLKEMQEKGVFGDKKFEARIGVNTGLATVGNVGSKRRLNYAIMGDTVNTASRLEGANKVTQSDILISESVAEQLPESFILKEMATIQVKGKEQPTHVFEPIYMISPRRYARGIKMKTSGKFDQDISFGSTREEARNEANCYAIAQQHFRNGEFQKTIDALEPYKTSQTAQVIIERAEEMLANPPGEDWDGVICLTTK